MTAAATTSLLLTLAVVNTSAQTLSLSGRCPFTFETCDDVLDQLPDWCPNPWDACTGSPPLYHPLCKGVGDYRECFVQCASEEHIVATRGRSGCWVQRCAPGTKWCDATCDCQHVGFSCPEGAEGSTNPPLIIDGVAVREGVLTFNDQGTFEDMMDILQALVGDDDDALDLFEESISHNSVRRLINALEEDGDEASPEKDFIHDIFLETMLNEDGKILIGDKGYIVTRDITYELVGVDAQMFAAATLQNLASYNVIQHVNDPDGGGDRRKLQLGVSPCDGWKSCSADTLYNYGNRKFKSKIWIRNLPFYASAGTRTKHYRRKSNGKYKKERADEIYAAAAIAVVDRNCDNLQQGSLLDNKYNKKSVQESITWWAQTTKAHAFVGFHLAQDNGVGCQRSNDLFNCNKDTLSCGPVAAPAPSPGPSCMAGSTGVLSPGEGGAAPVVKAVEDLFIGEEINGLDENGEPAWCTVKAMGYFGPGPVFGNYTEDHYVMNLEGDAVSMHGVVGPPTENADKYALLTTCPVGTDESGVNFTPLDSDFFGEGTVSWSDYVLIHKAIVKLVNASGGFWFNPTTYISMETVQEYTTTLYRTMLQCLKDPGDCDDFEHAAEMLVENALTDDAKAIAKSFFSLGQTEDENPTMARAAQSSVSAVILGI